MICCSQAPEPPLKRGEAPRKFEAPPWPPLAGKEWNPAEPATCELCGWKTRMKRTVAANGAVVERRVCANQGCKHFGP